MESTADNDAMVPPVTTSTTTTQQQPQQQQHWFLPLHTSTVPQLLSTLFLFSTSWHIFPRPSERTYINIQLKAHVTDCIYVRWLNVQKLLYIGGMHKLTNARSRQLEKKGVLQMRVIVEKQTSTNSRGSGGAGGTRCSQEEGVQYVCVCARGVM